MFFVIKVTNSCLILSRLGFPTEWVFCLLGNFLVGFPNENLFLPAMEETFDPKAIFWLGWIFVFGCFCQILIVFRLVLNFIIRTKCSDSVILVSFSWNSSDLGEILCFLEVCFVSKTLLFGKDFTRDLEIFRLGWNFAV